MKLLVEKLPNNEIGVSLTTGTAKRPMVATLSKEQAETLIALLQSAVKADRFKFQLEL